MTTCYNLFVNIDLDTLEVDINGHETMFPFEMIALSNELQNQYLDIVLEKNEKCVSPL